MPHAVFTRPLKKTVGEPVYLPPASCELLRPEVLHAVDHRHHPAVLLGVRVPPRPAGLLDLVSEEVVTAAASVPEDSPS